MQINSKRVYIYFVDIEDEDKECGIGKIFKEL